MQPRPAIATVTLIGSVTLWTFSGGVPWSTGSGELALDAVLEAYGCVDAPEAQTPPGAWPPDWRGRQMLGGDIPPVRAISDPYPNFHGLALDVESNRVVMSDSNRHGLLVYDREAATTDPTAVATPLSWVRGPATGMMFVSGVIVDPERKEMYTVDNDIGDRLVTFSYEDTGNAAPKRVMIVPHQAWGLALDKGRDQIAITVESSNMIAVFRRGETGEATPVRVIRGTSTQMADPHGVAFDGVNDEYIVVNHGNRSHNPGYGPQRQAGDAPPPGFQPPSITIFAAGADGDVAPVRVIQGDRTGLDWPMGVAVAGDEIAVGNHADNSILVFSRTAQGNVAPIRRIKGPRTRLAEPISVAFDVKRDEIWVTNYNDHSALVFARTARGDAAPLRHLRNGPPGSPVPGFGNAGAVAYDSKRQEILVPN